MSARERIRTAPGVVAVAREQHMLRVVGYADHNSPDESGVEPLGPNAGGRQVDTHRRLH